MKSLKRKTKQLVVRPLESADYQAWKLAWSMMLPPKNRWDRRNKEPSALARAAFTQLLKQQKELRNQDRFYDLGVFSRATGELVGMVSVMDVLRGVGQSGYLGYSIFNRHWGKGWGKEAVRAIIDIGFRDLLLHRLEAGIEPGNHRSKGLALSLGFRREGLKRRAVFLRGGWLDLAIYALTCEDCGIPWRGQAEARKR